MLRNKAWLSLAHKHETLCDKCFYTRSIERQVYIGLAELLPCLFNLFHSPHSWFDLFLRREDAPLPSGLIDEWRQMVSDGGPLWRVEAIINGKLPEILR
jgi:hypothetical protein